MTTRSMLAALAATAALTLAACGSSDGEDAGVSVKDAKAAVERSADVRLSAIPVPDEAADQGLEASFSNASSAVRDGQVVLLFVLESAGVADRVSDMVEASVPASSEFISRGNVLVVYAANGTDHAAAVTKAVKAL
jgi:hypothetical protein